LGRQPGLQRHGQAHAAADTGEGQAGIGADYEGGGFAIDRFARRLRDERLGQPQTQFGQPLQPGQMPRGAFRVGLGRFNRDGRVGQRENK
jgi:hypothetical protein